MRTHNWILPIALFLLSFSAHAIESSTDQPDSRQEKTLYEWLSNHTVVTLASTYKGPALSRISNSFQPRVDGSPDVENPQFIENYLTVGYRLKKDVILGAVGHFNYFPLGKPVGRGHRLTLMDPAISISTSDLVKRGRTRIAGGVALFLPASSSDFLMQNHSMAALSPTFDLVHTSANRRLEMGIFGYVRGYVPAGLKSRNDGMATHKIVVAPHLNYEINDRVAATLWIDLFQIYRRQGTGFLSGMSNESMDIEPGIKWRLSDKIMLNPIVNIYPAHPTVSSTSFQAIFVANAF